MIVLDYIYYSVASFLALFVYYVAIMELAKHFGKTWWVKAFAGLFLICDWLVNLLVISVWFLQLPHKPFQLVTGRLKQWRKEYEYRSYLELSQAERRRLIFAVYICDRHLDKYDLTGDHC